MNTQDTYETGATSHVVNDLILFTDNTRELAEMRDHIFLGFAEEKEAPTHFDMSPLFRAAKKTYKAEIGHADSLHITQMTDRQITEYCTLFAQEFNDWKKEHGY